MRRLTDSVKRLIGGEGIVLPIDLTPVKGQSNDLDSSRKIESQAKCLTFDDMVERWSVNIYATFVTIYRQ